MDERLAVVVASVDELLTRLRRRRRVIETCQARGRERQKPLFERGDLDALAQMWIEGRSIEWDDLYVVDRPYRLPLPTYPFAKEVCFSLSLSATEYCARDHQVNGESFFPAAGFLELACVNGTIAGEASVTRIKDIVWIQPLRLTTEDHLVKTFLMSSENETQFVIVSFNDDNERVVYSEGRMFYERQSKHGDEVQARYSIEANLLLGAAPDADALRAHLQNEQEQDCVDDPGILAHRGHRQAARGSAVREEIDMSQLLLNTSSPISSSRTDRRLFDGGD